MEPIAVIGFSLKMPQEAVDESSLWDILRDRKNLMTEYPESRTNINSFHKDHKKPHLLPGRGAHFIKDDPACFDAPFFSVTQNEAAGMDPQQRWILETSYHAFENAGISMSSLKGMKMGVFDASTSDDYTKSMSKDPDTAPLSRITGTADSMRSNRVSWFFGLQGPSLHVDTACSSSLVAVDLACQSLQSGSSSSALVIGCNLILGPEVSMGLANQGFLSPDSLCYSFDHRANGFSRGEGIIAMIFKPLSSALQDGDMIRAVIRGTGANSDGHTPGLTQPSSEAQERLIRQVYQRAGLDFASTRYFEAHGTGTPTGDPIEMKAIGRVFRSSRSSDEPLYVGSIKSNVGHLEGGAGLAGIVKAILILEKGIIPPVALFEKLNPDIDAEFYNLHVPTTCVPWPSSGVRRVSVNSFGMGGTNAHAILDDAYSYLSSAGLNGHHQCELTPRLDSESWSSLSPTSDGRLTPVSPTHPTNGNILESLESSINLPSAVKSITSTDLVTSPRRLLVWSAADEASMGRVFENLKDYHRSSVMGSPAQLGRLAFTLSDRRTHLAWRTFAVVGGTDVERELEAFAKPERSSLAPGRTMFVFTGQGAQYAGMGLELLQYEVFRQTLSRIDDVFASLGATWSVLEALDDKANINRPDYSQPLCTALQISLVELMKEFGVPSASVVGHSSGEIAAAYAIGALSLEEAVKIAFYRGKLTARLKEEGAGHAAGAMMSVNLSLEKAIAYIATTTSTLGETAFLSGSVSVACINSPLNCTLSGAESSIDILKAQLDEQGVFAQKLNTGVAYHSAAMQQIAGEYVELLSQVLGAEQGAGRPRRQRQMASMVSSVTGKAIKPADLRKPQYWADNLVSRVNFLGAITEIAGAQKHSDEASAGITDIIEIGPHAALRRPVQDILHGTLQGKQSSEMTNKHIRYHSMLMRNKSPVQSTLELVGALFCRGLPVSISAANRQLRLAELNGSSGAAKASNSIRILTDMPKYPFDRSSKYWHESRTSVGYRLRHSVAETSDGSTALLGTPVNDWNPLEPRWRNFINVSSLPWTADHIVNQVPVLAGTCMVTMAIEAAKQHYVSTNDAASRQITGFWVKEAQFLSPVLISKVNQGGTETIVHLRPMAGEGEGRSRGHSEIQLFACDENSRWKECFRCIIQVATKQDSSADFHHDLEEKLQRQRLHSQYDEIAATDNKPFAADEFYKFLSSTVDLTYLDAFALLEDIHWDGRASVIARINRAASAKSPKEYPLHPVAAVLDASLHVMVVQMTKGLSDASNTMVLSGLDDTWISSDLFEVPPSQDASHIRILSIADKTTLKQRSRESTVFGLDGNGAVLFNIGKCRMSEVTSADSTGTPDDAQNAKKLLYSIEWKPQLSLLSPDELNTYLSNFKPLEFDKFFILDFYPRIERAMTIAARKVLADPQLVGPDALKRAPSYITRLVESLRYYYAADEATATEDIISEDDLEKLLLQCERDKPDWAMFPAVARNLKGIVRGDMNAVEVLFSSRLMDDFYTSFFVSVWDDRFEAFLDLLSHENPCLRILEVGAGTGGMTQQVLSTFKEITERKGRSCFSNYTYSDISPGFFEPARERFANFGDRMTYRTLDLEKDSHSDEGFELGAYDVIFAGSVLHATHNLAKTMHNVRQLLKPGGYLILLELICPTSACGNVGFGSLEGWWLSTEEWRSRSPLLTETQWNSFFRETGFSESILTIRDHGSDVAHTASLMVSRKVESLPDSPAQFAQNGVSVDHFASSIRPCFVIDSGAPAQVELAHILMTSGWRERGASVVNWSDIEDQCQSDAPSTFSDSNAVFVMLLEIGNHWLADIPVSTFTSLQRLMSELSNILWVTETGISDAKYPYYSTMKGFLRALRTENSSKHIVTLAAESLSNCHLVVADDKMARKKLAESIDTVLETFCSSQIGELEWRLANGVLETPRMVEEIQLNDTVYHQVSPSSRVEQWLPGPALELKVKTPGLLDSITFVEDLTNNLDTPLAPYEIEMEAKAWPLSFRDLLTALGRMEYSTPGIECAGVVTRMGSAIGQVDADGVASEPFKPGDRVVSIVSTNGCMRTYPRALSHHVHRIPDGVSFENAVSSLNPGMTAWYGLVCKAKLQKNEKILIHSAAGATGQMALCISMAIGAEIFVTVGNVDKKKFLMDEFGIDEDHIFSSRGTSFAAGIKRMTGEGVDVVFNSLSGKSLVASWECMAPFGRFIEIGKADIMGNSMLPMSIFAKNISFMAVDLWQCFSYNKKLTREISLATLELINKGVVQPPTPLALYPMSDVEGAFRYLQSGKTTGRIILTSSHEDMVKRHTRAISDWKLKSDVSYLIVGGLGGIGRAIMSWMADRGAKNLIVLSRSGLSSTSKSSLSAVEQLQEKGVRVEVVKCDVSSAADLSVIMADLINTMPPVKGCINAAMVLQDAVFENMTHQMWTTTLDSKIKTSWNLHQLLPVGTLDFFILLSSVAGVYGSISQSNYAAGCTFQDALANQRASQGDNTASLNLGWMRTVGIIAEMKEYQRKRQQQDNFAQVETEELLAVIGEYCRGEHKQRPQVIVGGLTPAEMMKKHGSIPPYLQQPFFSGFSLVEDEKQDRGDLDINPAILFAQAVTPRDRSAIVVQAVVARLARALGVSSADIEPGKALSDFGVDSLMAVELRNWIGKDFKANVAVFDIMSGISIIGLGDLITERTSIGVS
ncbi:hypothetical protein B0I35DRAFT_439590 [Stachybotrys elegans]|uniref:Carrier domain-containing protein n=1 Tax=Stachybotrys elegans TaxID=80388 RepID=A0A8K0SPU7_9HYPO|nr:hypothetical protein B0I35DRAFT_439590 [Stachybotrys elegans]